MALNAGTSDSFMHSASLESSLDSKGPAQMYSSFIAWVTEHSETLNLAVNLAMLCVWILYFQLLLQSFRRQKRSNILINHGAGSAPTAAASSPI